ncbi:hypothetical protein CXF68_09720 [Tenacibaculum sp. Bg11-29]|uniref:hypothetical protein n=1 Tax=Tenacibaculum sp. Bg11-29 TaxID=2058306 RepID=UPI000C332D28|nr:hypothetical protein [Tenacibaculum sp. Bg11-29]PKH50944.1 hypothetical protein CXF68_09720 [Tenacibaculum sp. Bg11-29]
MKIKVLFLLIPFLGFAQDYEIYNEKGASLVSDKSGIAVKFESDIPNFNQIEKKLQDKGYEITTNAVNNYFIVKKHGVQYISDISGNILKLPYSKNKSVNGNWQVLYPTRKGTIFMMKNWENKPESSTSNNIEIYDLKGNLLNKNLGPNISFKMGMSNYFSYIITKNGDFITFHKNGKIGLLDEFGKIFLDAEYDKIENNGNYLFLTKNKSISIFEISSKKKLTTTFEEVKLTDFSNNFTSNYIISKLNSKYGLYHLPTQKWAILNQYDDFSYFFEKLGFDQGTKKARLDDVIYTTIFLAEKDGKKGAISIDGSIKIPIEYEIVNCQEKFCKVVNFEKSRNKFNLEKGQMEYKQFYKEIFPVPNTNIIAVKLNNNWKMSDENTHEIYFTEEDKITELISKFKYLPFLNVKFENNQTGIFSLKTKKFIIRNGEFGRIEGTKSYMYLRDKTNYKTFIVNRSGEVLFEQEKTKGRFAYSKSNFLRYKAGQYKKIYKCYNLEGKEVHKSECTPLYGN